MRPRTITSGDQDSRIAQMRAELARRIAAHVSVSGEQATAIPGLSLYRLTAPTACYAAEYETGMAVVAQGRKRVTLGRTTYVCDESTVFLTSVDVPLVSEVVAASEDKPLLALFLRLDLTIVREILDREELKQRDGSSQPRPSAIGETGVDLLQPCIRLVDLLDTPADIPFFSSLIHRELVYRLLQSSQGGRLRAIARLDQKGRGTAKALAWLRTNYTKPFHLDELAAMARMGISTFNHHFRAVTSISPLQYQKQLRLFAARERMLVEGLDATRAALEVGYESVNQFTREYKRLFGEPPRRNVKEQQLSSSSAA
ncbi:MAG TPA: AraC family transcriptional regulator [Terriglobales bacterium]|nr:AraC family transcriptional regulator [Terriglobales bacterium]